MKTNKNKINNPRVSFLLFFFRSINNFLDENILVIRNLFSIILSLLSIYQIISNSNRVDAANVAEKFYFFRFSTQ